MSNKELVRKQFGDKAQAYAISSVHAKGGSLARLLELVQPQPGWRALDVATAAGHTAHLFAPYVRRSVATDLTPQMLPKAADIARQKGIDHLVTSAADAEALPFASGTFDLVSCRIAPHHFPRADRFVHESARVLRPNGIFALVDNIVPGKRTRKKKEQAAYKNAADYLNAFEKLRDPSHHRALTIYEWHNHCQAAGLTLLHTETMSKRMEFGPWADRMRVTEINKTRLRAMLVQAPQIVQEFLTPEFEGDKIFFHLTEAIIIAQRQID